MLKGKAARYWLISLLISFVSFSVFSSNFVCFASAGSSDKAAPAEKFAKKKITPVDEADKVPEFKKFREEFVAKMKEKDVDYLMAHVPETIKYSFGVCEGRKGFMKDWELDSNPKGSKIWRQLLDITRLGGTFNKEKTEFTAPYVFTSFPDGFDSFEELGAIVGENVTVRSGPGIKNEAVAKLDYEVVKMVFVEKPVVETIGEDTCEWKKIRTADGDEGYVFGKYVRAYLDYRASFEKVDGKWMMNFFVSGD